MRKMFHLQSPAEADSGGDAHESSFAACVVQVLLLSLWYTVWDADLSRDVVFGISMLWYSQTLPAQ